MDFTQQSKVFIKSLEPTALQTPGQSHFRAGISASSVQSANSAAGWGQKFALFKDPKTDTIVVNIFDIIAPIVAVVQDILKAIEPVSSHAQTLNEVSDVLNGIGNFMDLFKNVTVTPAESPSQDSSASQPTESPSQDSSASQPASSPADSNSQPTESSSPADSTSPSQDSSVAPPEQPAA